MLNPKYFPRVDDIVQVDFPGDAAMGGKIYGAWVNTVDIPDVTLVLGENQGLAGLPTVGSLARIRFYDKDGLYALNGEVAGTGEEPLAFSVRVVDARRVQRRESFRWPVEVPVLYTLRRENDARDWDEFQPGEWRRVYSMDISAGGIRLKLPECVPKETAILLEIELPSGTVRAEGSVVRVRPLSNATTVYGEGCVAGIAFKDISKTAQDTIVRYLFKEQIKSRSGV